MGFFTELRDAFNEGAQRGRAFSISDRLVCEMSRDDAAGELWQVLQSMDAYQWQEFKLNYLNYSLTLLAPEKRVRATELFAFMNLLEHQYFRKIPEFFTDGRRLS